MPLTTHTSSLAAADGLRLSARSWIPVSPKATFVLIHGVCEHSGRYAELAEELAEAGIAVYSMDLRGHGLSEGKRIYIRRFDQHAEDIELLCNTAAAEHPALPRFVMGHSMGGAVALRYFLLRRPSLAGLILSAPAIRVAGGLFPILRHLARFASIVLPSIRLVRLGSHFLSRDPAVVQDFRSDPLVFHGGFPVRTGAEILAIGDRMTEDLPKVDCPLLLLHGTADRVTDPAGTRLLYEHAASTDKTLRLYDGLYHDLFHEPEREAVTAELVAWISRRG